MEGAWVLLQCLALVAILFTPVWIRPNSNSISDRFSTTSHSENATGFDRHPTSITSRVIPIPGPSFRKKLLHTGEWTEDLESETRQIRFEWALSPDASEEWRLASIERQNTNGEWDSVSLVSNEYGTPIGSVYLELGEGMNTFTALMTSAKTKEKKKILLHVAQKR